MEITASTIARVIIRPATLKDFDEMLFIEDQAHIYPWPESTLQWCLEGKQLRSFTLKDNKSMLGFAIYECVLDHASLLNLAIHPDWQGRGCGRGLLRKTLRQLDEHITRVTLEVRLSNASAIHLYQSEGFSDIGQRRDYYPSADGREDARVMELDLSSYRHTPIIPRNK
jgi:ribosomal-protein-alanine N-acetyltransferase